MTDTAQTFRLDLVRLWCWAAIAHGLFTALLVGVVLLAGRQVDWIAVPCVGIVPGLYWVVYGLKFRVTVSGTGLGWTDLDGSSHFARWGEIETSAWSGFLFFSALEFDVAQRGKSFIPQLLSDASGFSDAIREHAGPDHPMTRALAGDLG
jgi:hypothetical protein